RKAGGQGISRRRRRSAARRRGSRWRDRRRLRAPAPLSWRGRRHAGRGMLDAATGVAHAGPLGTMSFALVFSGQGTQHPAMLPWLVEDSMVRAMCTRLGTHDWRAAVADPAWAARNPKA